MEPVLYCKTSLYDISACGDETVVFLNEFLFSLSLHNAGRFKEVGPRGKSILPCSPFFSPFLSFMRRRRRWYTLRRLQEVVGCPAGDHGFAGSGAGIELQAED